MSGQYGPIVTLDQIEDAIEQLIRTWIDTYLGAVERDAQIPLRSIKRPDDTGYQFEGEAHAAPAGSFPIIQIHSPGDVSNPDLDADMNVSGEVAFAVRAFVHAGTGRRATRRLQHRWAAAIALLIEHKAGDRTTSLLPGLGCEVIKPVVQRPVDVPPAPGQDRWLGVAQVAFLVFVGAMRQAIGGPAQPDAPPPSPLPPTSPSDPAHTSTNVTVAGHIS
jgi:hypothetical protein